MNTNRKTLSSQTPLILAVLSSTMGMAVLLGWAFDLGFIKQPVAGLTAMNPLSALSFSLIGIALSIMAYFGKQKFEIGLYVLSAVPLISALLKFLGVPTDTYLFIHSLQVDDMAPFLMAQNTAFNLILLSGAVMLSISAPDRVIKTANVMVSITLVGALFAFIGYSYNITAFGTRYTALPMSIQSATCFVMSGLSLLILNSHVGFMKTIMSRNIGGTISRVLIPMALLFATLIGYTRLIVQAEFPISLELGVSLLLTLFVTLFVIVVILVAKNLNKEDLQRREAESELEQINTNLERVVIEREQELDINERRYGALIEQSVDGITLIDENSTMFYYSPSSERITGYTLDERRVLNAAEMFHPDDLPDVVEKYTAIRNNPGTSIKYEWRIKHKKGHYFWMEGVVTNHLNDPNIRAIVNIYRDVSERKLAEDKIAGSEKRFRALIENSSDAIMLTNEDLQVLYQSPSVERMTGVSLEHRRANPNVRYTHPDDIPALKKLIERSKDTPGKAIPFSWRVIHLFGHQIWIEGIVTNLLNDENVGAMVFNYRDITERRKLEEQQALFTSLVNSSSDAIISKSLDGIIMSWNRGAQLLFGYTAAEAIGENVMILIPPDLRKEESSILQRIRAGIRVDTLETRRIRKDGTVAYITLTASPIRNADGEVIAASHISHDISERLDSERKLRTERTMLRTLIDNIPDYIYVKDKASKHIINNKAMLSLIGASSEAETLGKSSVDFFGEGIAAGYLEEDKKILQTGIPMVNFEESTLTKSGQQKYLLTTKVPLNDEQNNVIGIVGISRDITTQKETELDLRTSKYFLERAQQVASIGHWTLEAGHAATSKIFLSTEACRIFNADANSFDGKLQSFLAYVHPEDLRAVNKAMSSALVNQTAYNMDHRVVLKDGTVKWVHVQTEVTYDEGRDVPMLLGILQDITQRKKIENEILSLNADLEKKVSQRTSQLEAVNKELEAFSYSVSHDLRAPLRIIDGFATILMEDAVGLDPKIVKHAKTISRNATRMGQLIDDLLNFSRLGRTQMKVGDVDMRALVDQVLEEFQSADMIRKAKITINELSNAKGDASLLKQVWVNLLSNAIKYSSKKPEALIEVGMVPGTTSPTWCVKDNGAGFSMEYSSKLFGVFQRLHKQDEFDGTGVGLALVQRIIVRHGGKVWAEAKPDEGATFFFTLEQ
jgi:PAS domain S-box-containing protein